ncbi:MAG: isoleucine--tRNA ligase [Alphaproteobacteria bacterium]|jgi:isoleucyl-tRNA synthetase|nr:isoleucine--tRNA ligase [Alphaproteobacteria bacterium]
MSPDKAATAAARPADDKDTESKAPDAKAADYKATVFLPRTPFPMRAGLPKKEPALLGRWEAMDLFGRLRRQSQGRAPFILHDGPPYANGNIHIGTGMNKVLKDLVVRSQQMMGRDANYVPGWDCHGLPIEWKIEEQYRAAGKDKDEVPILQFRQECRAFAEKWIAVQAAEFKRLGVVGNWADPYTTMTHAAEAQIAREIHKFLMNGGLYRGLRPVLWSVVEKTALAEAEVEYYDLTSTTIFVRFPVAASGIPALQPPAGGGDPAEAPAIVIWTTTPWTIPGNRALAYGEDIAYGLYRVEAAGEGSRARPGERLVVCTELAESVREAAGIDAWTLEESFPGTALAGTVCRHPFAGHGYEFGVPALAGDFVTTEAGTGIVHIAPSHGADDFELGARHGIEVPPMVEEDGRYRPEVPLFAGLETYTQKGKKGRANGAVIEKLEEFGALLAQGTLTHSYPHSWRSKAPLIFRATAQWFISMEVNDLRQKALDALDNTRFVPQAGQTRLRSMIETRPDWCISRQRAWGVPIAIFVHKASGEPLRDPAVNDRIAAAFEEEGSDAWFARDPQEFLGNEHRAADYERVDDIVDVWFESGSTHSFVLEARPELGWPAALYLEGSDQHRGWFHSSLLESCGTRGRAPYDAVLTHGFVLDEHGRKMAKSMGNVVAPQAVCDENGADILRLWVAGSDYSEDLRIGPEILKLHVDSYRRLRNTLRYVLGGLDGFSEAERLDPAEMPELERWVLHRLAEIDGQLRAWVDGFDFTALSTALHHFCAGDLSAFYLDIRKDVLYCDRPDSLRRRAVRTVLDRLFDCLTAWLAPITCFTAEEAWLARMGEDAGSVHERVFPAIPDDWLNPALAAKWQRVRQVRRVVTGALELERAEKRLGASLQAHPVVYVPEDLARLLETVDLADIAITSDIAIRVGEGPEEAFRLDEVPGVSVVPDLAAGTKCQRCWKVLPEVGAHAAHPALCGRCADAVDALAAHGDPAAEAAASAAP